MKTIRRLLLCLLLLLCFAAAGEAEDLSVSWSGTLRGFQENALTVTCPGNGTVRLTVLDNLNTYRRLEMNVVSGANTLLWDGLGDHQERMQEGSYSFFVEWQGSDGQIQTVTTAFDLKRCNQALLFALSNGDTYYRDGDWYVEYALVREGQLMVEFYRADDMQTLLATKRRQVGTKPTTYHWDGKLNGKAAEAGDYVLRLYATDNPAYAVEIPVTIVDAPSPAYQVAVTGKIMPEDGDDDATIWQLMTAPATVVRPTSAAKHTHQNVYALASKESKVLGTLHCGTQAVEVKEVREDGWCLIGAWNHEDGSYTEGYVPTDRLMVVKPQTKYGLLVNKRQQTMTIYEEGKPIWTMPISTGLAAQDRLIRETAAGSFITGEHMESFSDEGYTYSYPIRYDGGNLIHQLGWKKQSGKLDFSAQLPYLGQKASHGCVRMENNTGDGEINAYWIYTHIPAGTRIILTDDPEERVQQVANAEAGVSNNRILEVTATATDLQDGESELVLTLGGDVVLGTREKWQHAEDAFPAVLEQEGYDYPFKNLVEIFKADDMTFLNLECVLKSDGKGEDKDKLYRFRGLPAYTAVLWRSGVDQVNIANNHHIDYGQEGRASTVQALRDANMPYSGYGQLYIWEKDGHKIGFAGCRETIWRQDRTIIKTEVDQLRSLGCDVVIYSCHWGTEYSPTHSSDLQQLMAQDAVDAGVDIVVGTHPHVAQGIEYRGGTLIIYSLGNLMFGGTHDMTTFDAMLAQLRLRFSGDTYLGATLNLLPVLTSSSVPYNDFCPKLAEGEDALRILAKVQTDSDILIQQGMYFPAR